MLRVNATLLKLASPQGKTTTYRQVLQLASFDFGYFTHLYHTKQGNTYHCYYDYGYLSLPDEKVLIADWQPYTERGVIPPFMPFCISASIL